VLAVPTVPELCTPLPAGFEAEMREAGVDWDAVSLPAYLGDRVLAELADDCGAVIRDPYAHLLYWLIRPGTAEGRRFPDAARVRVLGKGSCLVVPPVGCDRSAVVYWARPVVNGCLLTGSWRLHARDADRYSCGDAAVTIPAARMRLTLAQAGERWDAVQVRADTGTQVVKKLGGVCGAVVADGRNMWFFVQPGDGYGLTMPGVTTYLRGDHVLIPADRVTTQPGPHWTRAVTRHCTPATRLLLALRQALG
jgi:hypothetical protein